MSESKKYYWLKLQRDFFKRHDIQIIEGMPNGEKYLIFYLKLLCESVDHDGGLRFSDEIPYDEGMLSIITHMDIDIVRAAVKLFASLKMMEIMDDGTFYMKQIEKMTGSETSWARKKSLYRETKREDNVPLLSDQCPTRDKSIEIRDKSLDIRDKSVKSDKPIDESSLTLSKLLCSLQKKIDTEYSVPESNIKAWARDIEKLHRIDGREYKDIEDVIRWVKTSGNFWLPNIMSGRKLRDKYPTLISQMKQTPTQNLQGKVRMKNDIWNGETF